MTKTIIGGVLLGTVVVFGAIVPLALIGLVLLAVSFTVGRRGRRLRSGRFPGGHLKS